MSGMIIDASVSYLDFKYDRVDPLTGITLNMKTPFTPEWKFSAGAQYKFEVVGAGWITPRLDYAYQSSNYSSAQNRPMNRVDAYGIFNGRITFTSADSDWEAAISVTNITNKFYYLNKYERELPPYFVVNGQPGRPREWAVSLKRRF